MGLLFLEKEESRTPTFEIQVRTLSVTDHKMVGGGLMKNGIRNTNHTAKHQNHLLCNMGINGCDRIFIEFFILHEIT